MVQSAQWIERVLLGDLAMGFCVVAVGVIGLVMLSGRLPVREGMRIVLGLSVVLVAPVIADGFAGSFGETVDVYSLQLVKVKGEDERPDLRSANFDPYAGASLGND